MPHPTMTSKNSRRTYAGCSVAKPSFAKPSVAKPVKHTLWMALALAGLLGPLPQAFAQETSESEERLRKLKI